MLIMMVLRGGAIVKVIEVLERLCGIYELALNKKTTCINKYSPIQFYSPINRNYYNSAII